MSGLGKRLDAIEDAASWAHRILADEVGAPCTPEWVARIEDHIAGLDRAGVPADDIAATLADDLGVPTAAIRSACRRIGEVKRGHAR